MSPLASQTDSSQDFQKFTWFESFFQSAALKHPAKEMNIPSRILFRGSIAEPSGTLSNRGA